MSPNRLSQLRRRALPLVMALFDLPAVNVASPVARGQQTFQTESQPRDDRRPIDGTPDGFMIIEEDIIVPEDFYERRATTDTSLWPDGVVYFEFDANVSGGSRLAMLLAMEAWIDVSGVAFVPKSDWDANWVHIQDSTSNSSFVGMLGIGSQPINIFNWDFTFIMAHELGHALGFWHEQSRPDRETACGGGPCVRINDGNICQNCCNSGPCDFNFDPVPGAGTVGPYDFDSVMHYDQCAFSTVSNCPDGGGETITVLPPNEAWQDAIGQRDHLSTGDALGMQSLYGVDRSIYVDRGNTGGDGSLSSPYESFVTGMANAPAGATVFTRDGSYSAVGTYSSAVVVRAHSGAVFLGS